MSTCCGSSQYFSREMCQGSGWRSPSCLHAGNSGFSRSNQHAPVSAENYPIWLYWWILYNQLHFDMYQCENNSGIKAAGIPQSQQPNSEHHEGGSKVCYEILFPNYTSVGINISSALQEWERWVLLPEISLGLEGGKREDHAPYSASKVCFNYMTHRNSTFFMKYKNTQKLFILYINLLNLMIFTSLSIALILGFLFFTKEENRKSNNISQMSFIAAEKWMSCPPSVQK